MNENTTFIDETSKELSAIDASETAFHKILDKLNRFVQSKIQNVWHITTIVNTFNSYYCFDVHYGAMQEIKPITLKLERKDQTMKYRLAFIEVRDVKGLRTNRVYFDFHFVKSNGTSKKLYKYDLESMLRMQKTNTLFFANPAKDDILYPTGIELVSDNNKRHYIDYTNIAPIYGYLYYDESSGYYADSHGIHHKWVVNPRYVLPDRVFSRYPYSNPPPMQLSNEERAYMINYMFGLDMDFINANFNGNFYKPDPSYSGKNDRRAAIIPIYDSTFAYHFNKKIRGAATPTSLFANWHEIKPPELSSTYNPQLYIDRLNVYADNNVKNIHVLQKAIEEETTNINKFLEKMRSKGDASLHLTHGLLSFDRKMNPDASDEEEEDNSDDDDDITKTRRFRYQLEELIKVQAEILDTYYRVIDMTIETSNSYK